MCGLVLRVHGADRGRRTRYGHRKPDPFPRCNHDSLLRTISLERACPTMTKTITFEFTEEEPNKITFEYSPEADERLDTLIENGEPIVYLNRSGLTTLAKILLKMSVGRYSDGFHVHLYKDFNADERECLTIMLHPDDRTAGDTQLAPAKTAA
jgi:hypothetical protein